MANVRKAGCVRHIVSVRLMSEMVGIASSKKTASSKRTFAAIQQFKSMGSKRPCGSAAWYDVAPTPGRRWGVMRRNGGNVMPAANLPAIRACRPAWNKVRIIGQKRPLMPKHVWAIRVRLEIAGRTRDLALFNLAIDSMLRGCDLARLKVADIYAAGLVKERASITQSKTRQPGRFEITEETRKSLVYCSTIRSWSGPSTSGPGVSMKGATSRRGNTPAWSGNG